MRFHYFTMPCWESVETQPLWQEYKGFVWVGDEPVTRVEILATSEQAAKDLVTQTYGDGYFVTVSNVRGSRPR